MAKVAEVIRKAADGGELGGEETADLFDVSLFTPESVLVANVGDFDSQVLEGPSRMYSGMGVDA